MKTITRTKIYLPIAGMILTAALALPAAAQTQAPFKGTFQGNVTISPPFVTQSITGIGTLVGQFSSTQVLATGPSGSTGTVTWIAANGDTIVTTEVGSGVFVDMAPCQVVGAEPGDTYRKSTQIYTITGGTGRFAGVQGSFTQTLYKDSRLSSDGTYHACGSYSGTITSPGAVR
ncbi:MAG TPA: hypothetical protein VKV74_04695 [Bryobacteraceae bacterium]|nr:hypothetical protein [Bryobacteraceae bacterium]